MITCENNLNDNALVVTSHLVSLNQTINPITLFSAFHQINIKLFSEDFLPKKIQKINWLQAKLNIKSIIDRSLDF